MKLEKALFAAGCFWGVEAAFKKVNGVQSVTSGYSGGNTANPTYEQVCTGNTGHAEAVLIEYDAEVVSYQALVEHLWTIHDPTQLNKQGPDVGTQYRSSIFYFNEEQRAIAEASKKAASQSKNIVTEIKSASEFYRAEEYHQNYFEKNG